MDMTENELAIIVNNAFLRGQLNILEELIDVINTMEMPIIEPKYFKEILESSKEHLLITKKEFAI